MSNENNNVSLSDVLKEKARSQSERIQQSAINITTSPDGTISFTISGDELTTYTALGVTDLMLRNLSNSKAISGHKKLMINVATWLVDNVLPKP